MRHPLDDVVAAQKAGRSTGLTSVCSAHPLVLEAAVAQAAADGDVLLVEATSNQVDQYGGYTGMRPVDFAALVHRTAEAGGLPADRVVLGGDHLGPNRWRSMPAEQAMSCAEDLVAAYVDAGFTKIHLDCSFVCAGDPDPLTDELVATRAARLMAVAEGRAAGGDPKRLRYVIGTEVPVPGGAHEVLDGVAATDPKAALDTLETHRRMFADAGVAQVWPRVAALVVQPGVEFDHLQVVDYRREATTELRHVLDDEPGMIFEAHSTDYQTVKALRGLVDDHWAVLKVGPGLTFALREALFALAAIESELLPAERTSRLPEVVEERMLADPSQWAGYYPGGPDAQRLARRYSFSDRLRYYWPDPAISAAADRLLANLSDRALPLPLLSAYLPDQYTRVRAGELPGSARAVVLDRVRDVLRGYAAACRPTTTTPEENR